MNSEKLTVKEKSQVITSEKLEDYIPDSRGLGFEFFNSMLLNRQNVAQIDPISDTQDSYGCLLRRCIRLSLSLLASEITRDDIICQCTTNHFNSCVPIISAFFLGVPVASLDPSSSPDEIINILQVIRPRIIFVSDDLEELIEDALEYVGIECAIIAFGISDKYFEFNNLMRTFVNECDFEPLPINDINDTAVILFSRGSPKGIYLSHYTLMVQLVNTASCWNLGKNLYVSNYSKEKCKEGFMVVMSFENYHCISALEVLTCSTMTGVSRVICPNFDAISAWENIDKCNVSFIRCTTREAIELYKVQKPEKVNGESLRMLVTSGTYFSKTNLLELRKLFPRCFITNVYEQAEVGGPLMMFNYGKPGDIRDQYERPTSCGKLLPGLKCKIIDPITEKILGVNQLGLLCFESSFLKCGCDNLKGLCDCCGWIRSKNIGFYDEKKCFYVLNSYEEVIKYNDTFILPSLIENEIKLHPAVEDAVLTKVADMNLGAQLLALVLLNKNMRNKFTEKDIEDFVNNHMQKLKCNPIMTIHVELLTSKSALKAARESERH